MTWLYTLLSITGAILNASGEKTLLLTGYAVWVVANALWVAHFTKTHQTAPAVLFSVYLIISLAGLWRWA